MSIWSGEVDGCFWSYHCGGVASSDWDAFIEGLSAFLSENRTGKVVYTVTYKADAPSAIQRKRLAELLERSGARRLAAHAFVSNSRVTRGVLTALGWFSAKKFEEKVFDDPIGGLVWLAEKKSGLDVRRVWNAVVRAVDEDLLWESPQEA